MFSARGGVAVLGMHPGHSTPRGPAPERNQDRDTRAEKYFQIEGFGYKGAECCREGKRGRINRTTFTVMRRRGEL